MPADQMIRMVRNTSKNPILERREREAMYNIPKPANLRQGVPPAERAETNKHAAIRKAQQRSANTSGNTSGKLEPTTKPGPAYKPEARQSTTDDFEAEFMETVAPIPTRRRKAPASAPVGQHATPRYRKGEEQYEATPIQIPWVRIGTWGCILITLAIIGYSILFLVVTAWIGVSNSLTYGAHHTAYTQVTLTGKQPTSTEHLTIVTSNVDGTIYVTVMDREHSTAHTYTGPTLKPDGWNNDVNGVVATATMQKDGSIVVSLIGSMNYFHPLFTRPTMQFTLVSDKQAGYKVVMP